MKRFLKRLGTKRGEFGNVYNQVMETEIDKNKVYIEEDILIDQNDYLFLEGISLDEFARRYAMELTILIEEIKPTLIEQIILGYETIQGSRIIRTGMKYDGTYVCLSDSFVNDYAVKLLENVSSFGENEIQEAIQGIKSCLESINWNEFYQAKKNLISIC